MAATAPAWLEETEAQRVEKWRARQLEAAGYPVDVAVALASFPDVDVHVAARLLEQGCPLATALAILT